MLTLLLGGRWGPRIEEHYGIDSLTCRSGLAREKPDPCPDPYQSNPIRGQARSYGQWILFGVI